MRYKFVLGSRVKESFECDKMRVGHVDAYLCRELDCSKLLIVEDSGVIWKYCPNFIWVCLVHVNRLVNFSLK